ncbi:MAG: ubiquinol-cytochrome c reductase iron-sulfur subunit [Pseudomonadota bacterium]
MSVSIKDAQQMGPSRRGFLSAIWKWLGWLAVAEVMAIVAVFFQSRSKLAQKEDTAGIIAAGRVDTFPPGSVTAFVQGKFYLSRLPDGGFLALSRQCTHLGCTIRWHEDKQKFICPCHGSIFDIHGERLSAPAARPLDIYALSIVNRTVRVDTGKRMRRSGFQVNRAVFPKGPLA